MKRFLIFAGVTVAVILVLGSTVMFFMRKHTKSFSPEQETTFNQGDLVISVVYNRPYKKDRVIFGELVPYDEVWRTGANEATTFETNKSITIEGKTLPAGKYSLWTIPGHETWTILFNSKFGQWGVNYEGKPNHDPAHDVLSVDIRAVQQDHEIEQFTIQFEDNDGDIEMVLLWDKTLVAVPITH